jgi:hypothetical protein
VEDTKGWDVGQGGLDFGTAGEHGPGEAKWHRDRLAVIPTVVVAGGFIV